MDFTGLFSINNLKFLEVIDISIGTKIGYIKDLKIDCYNNKVKSIILLSPNKYFLSKFQRIEVPWEKIVKIGVDVILIDGRGTELEYIS